MDLDLDEPEDALLVLAVLDDEDDRAGARVAASSPGGDPGGGSQGGCGSGCAGCGCSGCLLPALVIGAATAAGSGALPLAAILGLGALLLAVAWRDER